MAVPVDGGRRTGGSSVWHSRAIARPRIRASAAGSSPALAPRVGALLPVLLSVAPLPAQEPATETRINAAIDKGVEYLLSKQELDGSWLYHSTPRVGCTALIVYTLLKSGVDPEHAAIQRALARSSLEPVGQTYDTAMLLLALTTHDAVGHRLWIEELTTQLLEWQTGDWGYPGGADLSNTQYAALGLRAAALAGVEVPAEAWFDLAKALRQYRDRSGGYSYRSGGGGASGSMTSAGVGTLAICDAMLTRAGKITAKQAESFARAREEGLAWLDRNFSVETNPKAGAWLYYYLYGLERVGALCGARLIGEHDWYAEGASFLVADQLEDGSWGRGAMGPTQTCFALLFLRRATRPVTGDPNRVGGRRFGTQDPDAAVQVAATGDTPLTLWITGWGPKARALEWPGEKGQGPHVQKVEYRAGEHTIGLVRADRSLPAGAERYPCRHSFRASGEYSIHVRVYAIAPPTADPSGRVLPGTLRILDSPAFEVEIENVTPQWMLDLARDPSRNLMPRARPRAVASSVCSGGDGLPDFLYDAYQAVDNRLRTPWLADPADRQPTLTITLSEPQRADVIVVTSAMATPHQPGFFSRALELEVLVNGKDRHRVRMHSDERKKGRLALDEPVLVRELELEILWKVPGKGHPAVGLAEVELQLSGAR